uniref:Uncharacterized protein n=1 Tax=Chromera velia CCMP2878 TaxID=1169474 RepID=A0A0K6S8E8_9ALVE|eukprot:Cvel_24685.t1-p1 / transcript=Cvel_24685.t1 / gene=Cvel_24685 / organism=Chromera_velia_CCMP2878 / gene_product=hypothetical protein / transcript_product=hypothetical protein / location=Cvel_scaffold2704:7444-11263(+) / protein_length=302 / sequence_SO=supercontig / SO=protein_coding / is_pseudo=false
MTFGIERLLLSVLSRGSYATICKPATSVRLLFVSTGLESLRVCEWLRQSSSGLGVSPSEEEGRGGDPLEAVVQGARNLRSLFLVILAVGLRLTRVGDLAGGWFLSRTVEGGGADLVGSSGLSDVEDGVEAMEGASSVYLGSQNGSLSSSAGRMKAGVCVAFFHVGLLYMALKTLSATYLLCVPSTDLAYFVAVHDLVVKVIKLGLKLADYSPPSLFSSSSRQSTTGRKWWGKRSKSKKRRGREKKRKRKGREKRDKEGKDGGQGFLTTYLLCVLSMDLAYFVAVHDLVVKVIKLGLRTSSIL